jgi:hypothetical protein
MGDGGWMDGTPAAESRRGWIVRSHPSAVPLSQGFHLAGPQHSGEFARNAQAGALAVPGPACWSIAFHPVRRPSPASFDAVFSTESPSRKEFADTAFHQGSIVLGVSCESPQQQMLGTRLPEANGGWKCRNAAALSRARWCHPLSSCLPIDAACSWRQQTTQDGERALCLTSQGCVSASGSAAATFELTVNGCWLGWADGREIG